MPNHNLTHLPFVCTILVILIIFLQKGLSSLIYLVISQTDIFPSGYSRKAGAGGCSPLQCWQQCLLCFHPRENGCFYPPLLKCFWTLSGPWSTQPSANLYNMVSNYRNCLWIKFEDYHCKSHFQCF